MAVHILLLECIVGAPKEEADRTFAGTLVKISLQSCVFLLPPVRRAGFKQTCRLSRAVWVAWDSDPYRFTFRLFTGVQILKANLLPSFRDVGLSILAYSRS